ncbi:MAG TPA: formylmethanofuran dehydrogenase subunit C [Xanthobacteraceae bacterium]|nr:formylmethanofuran dehydrogenase subunit C [Xanthobacteraceae bacterium]
MKPLVLSLRRRPDQRLDMSPLVPHRLTGQSPAEIGRIALQTTRTPVAVGDIFDVRVGDPTHLRIEGSCDRLDQVGAGLMDGELVVDGDVGAQAGRLMIGGRLTIRGHAGPWAGSAMKGGVMEILRSAGDHLGGPFAGETMGMGGGVIVVRGGAGERIADRMRRGTIVVEGPCGAYAGSRMIAGTLVVLRRTGALPGYLMKRGTVVLGAGSEELSPTFIDCGDHELVAMRLLSDFIRGYSPRAAACLRGPLRRYAGDMAVLGKGEIFVGTRT